MDKPYKLGVIASVKISNKIKNIITTKQKFSNFLGFCFNDIKYNNWGEIEKEQRKENLKNLYEGKPIIAKFIFENIPFFIIAYEKINGKRKALVITEQEYERTTKCKATPSLTKNSQLSSRKTDTATTTMKKNESKKSN